MLHETKKSGAFAYLYTSRDAIRCSFDHHYSDLDFAISDWNDEIDEQGWFQLHDPLQGEGGDIILPVNWSFIKDDAFLKELNSELTTNHPLHGKAKKALARHNAQDDCLFLLNDNSYAIVHLTCSRNNEDGFPFFERFADMQTAINYMGNSY